MINWMILIIMTMFGALGGYFFKKATSHGIALQKTFIINLFIGGTLYVGSALLNILLLTKMPYTIVYPLTSITYLWTLLFLVLLLIRENNKAQVLGVFLLSLERLSLVDKRSFFCSQRLGNSLAITLVRRIEEAQISYPYWKPNYEIFSC